MATLHFSSSENFMDDPGEPDACEHEALEIEGYIEATYDNLRSGPHGDEIAVFSEGAWTLLDGVTNRKRFSDWAVNVV